MSAIRTLLEGAIDYAGLFPPAGLTMEPAVHNYAAYRTGETAWALGRFILPVGQLRAFEQAAAELLQEEPQAAPWRLSVLASPDISSDVESIVAFNARHQRVGDGGRASIEAVELKVKSAAEITDAMALLPPELEPFFEVPIDSDLREVTAALSATGGYAKVRTGGTVSSAFPDPPDLLRFVAACVAARVPFKATAGLHHPLRSAHHLTYEPGSETGLMFGFLNVFLLAAFLHAGLAVDEAASLLEEAEPGALRFERERVIWRSHQLELATLAQSRRQGCRSFGSCSFLEPVDDLKALHLL